MMNTQSAAKQQPSPARRERTLRILSTLALTLVLMLPSLAFASDSGGDDLGLGDLLQWLRNLLMGPLGKIGALCAFAVAIVRGIFQGSILGFLTGIGFACIFYYGPDIILGVFGASI